MAKYKKPSKKAKYFKKFATVEISPNLVKLMRRLMMLRSRGNEVNQIVKFICCKTFKHKRSNCQVPTQKQKSFHVSGYLKIKLALLVSF